MSITKQAPRTIALSCGGCVEVNDVAAGEAITPGMLVERYNASGTPKWRKHATAAGNCQRAVALNLSMHNKGIDDDYASSDLVDVVILRPGAVVYAILGSGEVVVAGDQLESKGNGTLRKRGSGQALFVVQEGVDNGASGSTTRVRAEAM